MLGSVHVWLTFHPPSLSNRHGRRFVSIGDLLVGHFGDSGRLDLAGTIALGLHDVEGRLFVGEKPGEGRGESKKSAQAGGLCSRSRRYARTLIEIILPIG